MICTETVYDLYRDHLDGQFCLYRNCLDGLFPRKATLGLRVIKKKEEGLHLGKVGGERSTCAAARVDLYRNRLRFVPESF